MQMHVHVHVHVHVHAHIEASCRVVSLQRMPSEAGALNDLGLYSFV